MTLLVAEDDPDQLLVRSMLLRQSGFEVLEADSYTSGLAATSHGNIGCAVIDLRLPTEQDGLRLIRDLKRAQPSLRIFVLTGSEAASSAPEMKLVDYVFRKGSPPSLLLQHLNAYAALEHRR